MLSLNRLLKLGAKGRKNFQHCFWTFDPFHTLQINSQQQATTCNRVWKRMQRVTSNNVALVCEQALRGALAAWWEKEGELATTSLEFEFHLQFPCGFPSTELSDFRQSARSGNEGECNMEKHVPRGNDIITNVISANQHFASTFLMQIFKIQRRSCKLSFLFPPRRQSVPENLLAG